MHLDDFEAFVAAKLVKPVEVFDDATKLAEIAAWQKFTLNRGGKSGRAFEPVSTRGDLADFIESALQDATTKVSTQRVFDSAREKISYRAIQATRLLFEGEFEDSLEQARNGQLTRGQWAFRVRALIREFGRQAFRDGLQDGGVDPNELSDEDTTRINELIREQSQYVTNLGEMVFKSEWDDPLDDEMIIMFASMRQITDAQAGAKPAMWFNRSIVPFYEAGKLSADANGLYEWVIGATEESCQTCLKANGQRHRLKHWHRSGILPQSNGTKELECKGFNCKCNLVRVSGKARGRLDRIPAA